MSKNRLLQVPDEYRQLFRFFFLYRIVALLIALAWILYKRAINVDITGVSIGWIMLAAYTAVIYIKREQIYPLVLSHRIYLVADVLISFAYISGHQIWDSPYYFYTMAPIVTTSVLYRFRGAIWSSTILGIGGVVSIYINGPVVPQFFYSPVFFNVVGGICAYYVVGFMCIYPADMIVEISRQRALIKERAEIDAVQEERSRLAMEFHDNLAQMLISIKIKTALYLDEPDGKSKEAAQEISDMASTALEDLRNAIYALSPQCGDNDLEDILKECCRRLGSSRLHTIETDICIDDTEILAEQKYQILRICQEAIINAIRHSGARRLEVKAMQDHGRLKVDISDHGCGFEVDKPYGGIGLVSMRERAERLSAKLEISSQIGAGTTVRLTVPIANANDKCEGPKNSLDA